MFSILVLLLSGALAQTPHWAVLHYLSTEPVTEQTLRPVVAWVDEDGQPRDWFFDSVVLYSYPLYHYDGHPTEADLTTYTEGIFEDGGLVALADTVATLRVELNDPGYRLGVWLDGITLDRQDAIARSSVLQDRFDALGRDELQLLGFYWGWNEAAAPADFEDIRAFNAWVHGQGLRALWIPYYGAESFEQWSTLGFDHAPLQPGYAFYDVGLERFALTDDDIRAHDMGGVEIELGPPWNPQVGGPDPQIRSALAYFEAMDHYNWTQSSFNACYHSSEVSDYASQPEHRPIYDGLYRVVAAYPERHTVREQHVIRATADTFIQTAAGYEDVASGDSVRLNLGSNAYPNGLRTWLRFDLQAAPPAERVVGAWLMAAAIEMPYGDVVDDIELWQVEDGWDESTLTTVNQPASLSSQALASHRFAAEASWPRWHAIDVTDTLLDALDQGRPQISFMLRRRTEDGTEAEISLWSREAGDEVAPRLVLLVEPETTTDPDTGEPTDTGSDEKDTAADTDSAGDDDTRVPADEQACSGCASSSASGGWLAVGLVLSATGLRRRRRLSDHRRS